MPTAQVSVFKLKRSASSVAHTGLLLRTEDRLIRCDHGYASKAAASSGTLALDLTMGDMGAAIIRPHEEKKFMASLAKHVMALEIDYDADKANELDAMFKDVLHPEKPYNGALYNCRDYCVKVLKSLKTKYRMRVNESAFAFLDELQLKDALVVTSAVGIGIGVLALLFGTGNSRNERE
eukprot:m.30412 g.30412  ORF g.30412 m.30412 type:complete len:179 (-) comp9430_c0_seq1:117-653(-)